MNNIKKTIKTILEREPKASIKEVTEELCKLKGLLCDHYMVRVVKGIINSSEELKALSWSCVGYGINIGRTQKGGEVEYERYSTVETLEKAQVIFRALTGDLEVNLWDEVEIEKIWERGDEGDYDYEVVQKGHPNNGAGFMKNETYWDRIKLLNQKKIYSFDLDADRDGDRILNICWLALGYVSPDSGCGFFYYSSKKQFERLFSEVKHISDESLTKGQIKDYLEWLESNEVLFRKDKSQVEQIVDMLCREQ